MTVNRERKMVNTRVDYLDLYHDMYHDTLADARKQIDHLIAQYGETAQIQPYREDYDDTDRLGVFVDRIETDEQMAKRIAQEERMEDLERYRYEQLKAKFG